MRKQYFVSYSYENKSDKISGDGYVVLTLKSKIKTFEDIQHLITIIKDKFYCNSNTKIVILNFIKL